MASQTAKIISDGTPIRSKAGLQIQQMLLTLSGYPTDLTLGSVRVQWHNKNGNPLAFELTDDKAQVVVTATTITVSPSAARIESATTKSAGSAETWGDLPVSNDYSFSVEIIDAGETDAAISLVNDWEHRPEHYTGDVGVDIDETININIAGIDVTITVSVPGVSAANVAAAGAIMATRKSITAAGTTASSGPGVYIFSGANTMTLEFSSADIADADFWCYIINLATTVPILSTEGAETINGGTTFGLIPASNGTLPKGPYPLWSDSSNLFIAAP